MARASALPLRPRVAAGRRGPAAARSGLALPSLVLSCEHATNHVPAEFAKRMTCSARFLATHRGYDAGALEVARVLALGLRAPLIEGSITRLLVDLNRPEGDPSLFSRFLRGLADADREHLLRRYHRRHWRRVQALVERKLALGPPVLHVAVHSFTPRLRGELRRADIGFLFDPARSLEHSLCARWRSALHDELARHDLTLEVMHNSPYSGSSPGLATSLRARLPAARYLGIEIEINQRLWRRGGAKWQALASALAASLRTLVLAPARSKAGDGNLVAG